MTYRRLIGLARWGSAMVLAGGSLAGAALSLGVDEPPAETKPGEPAPPASSPSSTPPAPTPAAPATAPGADPQPGAAGPPKPAESPKTEPPASKDSKDPKDTGKAATKDEEPEVVVLLNDGRRFTGFLFEKNATEIILKIAGIKTPFRMSQVEKYTVLPPVLERYAELRKAIDEEDPEQVIRLAEWLTARQKLDLALQELDGMIRRQPENARVVMARTQLLRQIDLRNKAVKPIDGPAVALDERSDLEIGQVQGMFEGFGYLTETDIALMKVYEINLSRPPRVEVPRDAITALLENHGGHPAIPTSREGRDGLYRLPAREQLELLFKVRARELYSQVKVIDQPETMRIFRDEVQRTWLLPSCATAACHGGAEAGRLVLGTRKPGGDANLYTNFYILQNFKLADGTALVNFDEPEKSPLLQMALPREDAQIKHPRVLRGTSGKDMWKPAFRARDEARFQQAVAWLKSAYRPRPDYGIRYEPARPFTAGPTKPMVDPGR